MDTNSQKRIVVKSDTFKTTKPHMCWGCGNQISPSEKVFGTKVRDEEPDPNGVTLTTDWLCYWCEVCHEYMVRHKPDPRYNGGISLRGIIKTDQDGWRAVEKIITRQNKC